MAMKYLSVTYSSRVLTSTWHYNNDSRR